MEVITEHGGPTMLSRILGFRSTSLWYNYLDGKSQIGVKVGMKIQAATGVRYEWLRDGTGEKYLEKADE